MRRGDLGTGHQNRETPRQAKSRQSRSELFSPVQPQPTWQGRCRPSRLLVVVPGYFQSGKPSVLLIVARALLHTTLEQAPSLSCTTAPSRLGLSLGQLQKGP